jgi:hypothetical protein
MKQSAKQRRVAAAKKLPLFLGSPQISLQLQNTRKVSQESIISDTVRGYSSYYKKYGILDYHSKGINGAGVSIVIIDSGLIVPESGRLENVKLISLRHLPVESGKCSQHGVAVASLIAAKPMNDMGGIAPESSVTLINVDDVDGEIKLSAVLYALQTALKLNPDIVNISLGTDTADDDLHIAIKALIDQGIVVLAAAGNSGSRVYEFPASCPGVICVGSLNEDGNPSVFNSRNDTVTVFAPGESVISGVRIKDSFDVTDIDGTSFSSPFAGAVLALHLCDMRTTTSLGIQKTILNRDEVIRFLRTTFNNDCSTHIYVQENFSHFGCSALNFNGREVIISAPTCAPQFRLALFWFAVSICLGGSLALTLLGKTAACKKVCKVIFGNEKKQ